MVVYSIIYMWYQGCRSCKKRLGKDHQDAKRCPKCPGKISKRKNSVPKKTQGKPQRVCSRPTIDRDLRSGLNHNYAEQDSDDANIEEDSEEDSDEMQQVNLRTSADPRRVGEGDGETIILTSRELRKTITLQQTAKDQTIWMTIAQTGFPLEREEDEVTSSKDAQVGRITEKSRSTFRFVPLRPTTPLCWFFFRIDQFSNLHGPPAKMQYFYST